jgi:hypothetical protein
MPGKSGTIATKFPLRGSNQKFQSKAFQRLYDSYQHFKDFTTVIKVAQNQS